MNLIVNDLHTNVAVEGDGLVVLFLHGWGSDSAAWRGLAEELKRDHRVIAPDLPGFGGTQQPPEAWGVEEYSDWVVALLEKLKITKLQAIVGHSMGGRIALNLTGCHKVRAERLILLGSHGFVESKTLRNRAYAAVAKSGKLATAVLPATQRAELRRKLYKRAGAGDYLEAGELQESFLKLINYDSSDEASHVTVPTLLIYGEHDDQTPPSYGQRFKTLIPDAKLEILPAAGHYIHHDQPETVAGLIRKFL